MRNGSSDTLVTGSTELRSKETQNTRNEMEIPYNLGMIEISNEYLVSFFRGDNIVTKDTKKALKGMKREQWKFP